MFKYLRNGNKSIIICEEIKRKINITQLGKFYRAAWFPSSNTSFRENQHQRSLACVMNDFS